MIKLFPELQELTVVCLAAHPDDIEIGCGATLLALAANHKIRAWWLTMTGTSDREAEELAAAAAFLPGSEVRFARLEDGCLPSSWRAAKQAMHSLAAEAPSPDLIFAPRTSDAHQDHRAVGQLVTTVWRDSMVLHYEIPKWDGDLSSPNIYVQISEELAERKVRLLGEHFPSQHGRDWWDRDLFLGLLRVRGVEARARYAEGFFVTKSLLGVEA